MKRFTLASATTVAEQIMESMVAAGRYSYPDATIYPGMFDADDRLRWTGAIAGVIDHWGAELDALEFGADEVTIHSTITDLTSMVDDLLGQRLIDKVREADSSLRFDGSSVHAWNEILKSEFAVWLAKPENQVRDTYPDPSGYGAPPGHDDLDNSLGKVFANLKAWTHNDVSDLAPGVDEQALALQAFPFWDGMPFPGICTWPNSHEQWRASGDAKSLLGEVMKYKRYRLSTVPNLGQSTGEVDRVAELERELAASKQAHEADMRLIERVLKAEARARNWCSEYEDVVHEHINPRLSGEFTLSTSRLWEVTWTERYYIDVPRFVVVEAPDEDEAIEASENSDRASDDAIVHSILHDRDPVLESDVEGRRASRESADQYYAGYDAAASEHYQAEANRVD